MPTTTGFTNSRWLGFGGIEMTHFGRRLVADARAGAGVVLHVARPAEVFAERLVAQRLP